MQKQKFQSNEVIFKEGSRGESAYFLLSGKIEVLKTSSGGEIALATLGEGAVFGEMSLFGDAVRSATIRVLEDCEVQVISKEYFDELVSQSAVPLNKIMSSLADRLRSMNERVVKKEKVTHLIDLDIRQIKIFPDSQVAQKYFEEEVVIDIAQLPYRFGGYAEGEKPNHHDRNHIYFASNTSPLMVSRNHGMIEIDTVPEDETKKAVFFTDKGSRMGTIVNGVAIGRGKGIYQAPLNKGENHIILGTEKSQYKLKVICE